MCCVGVFSCYVPITFYVVKLSLLPLILHFRFPYPVVTKFYIQVLYSFIYTECYFVPIYILMVYVYVLKWTDPLGCIIDRLKVRRPKQRVTEKLLEMGLIQDRKEVRKKRVKKSKHNAFPGKLGLDMLQFS